MKKIFMILIFIYLLSPSAFGAASEDIYVRQDVFDAKMENLFLRLHSEIENLGNKINGRIDALSERVDGNFLALSSRIDGLDKRIEGLDKRIDGLDKRIDGLDKRIDGLDKRVDGLDKRIDGTNTFLYYLMILLGTLLILPFVNKWFEDRKASKNFITLDEVRRLIEENNAKLSNIRPQA